jgi:hypothetical protein
VLVTTVSCGATRGPVFPIYYKKYFCSKNLSGEHSLHGGAPEQETLV